VIVNVNGEPLLLLLLFWLLGVGLSFSLDEVGDDGGNGGGDFEEELK
jgi:hypothetical protein